MATEEKISPLIFREYDVRGIVGKELNSSTIYMLGKAIGTYIQHQSGKSVAIGQDNRSSSDELKKALINGIIDTGCNVVDIGLSTSPFLYISTIEMDLGGGVNITGSHNPIQYNGFKIVKKAAYPLDGSEIKGLYELINSGDLLTGKGELTTKELKTGYYNKLLGLSKLSRPMKVVVDTGNGVAGAFAPELLRKLGCEVVELYCELDGSFPNHLPNPEHEEYMEDLKRIVVSENADLGIGFDGDGDRLGLVDDKGNFLSSDYTLMLLARDFLERNKEEKVLIDIKSSGNVEYDVIRHSGKPVVWKTGHSLMKKKMREDNIILGGEFSGHMFVSEKYYPVDDALYAATRVLDYLSRQDKPLSEQFNDLPKLYATPLIEVGVDEDKKFDTISQLVETFSRDYDVITIDGVKIKFTDGWGLVRASNTTPTLNLRFEASTPDALAKNKEIVFDVLKKFPSIRIKN